MPAKLFVGVFKEIILVAVGLDAFDGKKKKKKVRTCYENELNNCYIPESGPQQQIYSIF